LPSVNVEDVQIYSWCNGPVRLDGWNSISHICFQFIVLMMRRCSVLLSLPHFPHSYWLLSLTWA